MNKEDNPFDISRHCQIFLVDILCKYYIIIFTFIVPFDKGMEILLHHEHDLCRKALVPTSPLSKYNRANVRGLKDIF